MEKEKELAKTELPYQMPCEVIFGINVDVLICHFCFVVNRFFLI